MKRAQDDINLIRDFHVIEKRIAALDRDPKFSGDPEAQARERTRLEAELNSLGGIDAYQKASLSGEKQFSFNSAHWVLDELHKRRVQIKEQLLDKGTKPVCTLLDVGAIKNKYDPKSEPRVRHLTSIFPLETTSIDLNPQDKMVIKANFLDFAQRHSPGSFSVVVLSLCINFEGNPAKRGEMLRQAAHLLPEGGLCFVLLPAPCINNSRYMNLDLFLKTMGVVGLELADDPANKQPSHKTAGKLFFAVARKRAAIMQPHTAIKRTLCRGGKHRNNFCIIVKALVPPSPKAPLPPHLRMSKSARRNLRAKMAKRRQRAQKQGVSTQPTSSVPPQRDCGGQQRKNRKRKKKNKRKRASADSKNNARLAVGHKTNKRTKT